MDSESILRVRGLEKWLPSGGRRLTILDGIDLEIPRRQFAAIVGPSGSGKSTLLGLMAGLDRPSAGEVWIDGHAVHDASEDELAVLRRRLVGFVFQSFQLLANLSARENVMLPLELLGRRDARDRADRLLDSVGLSERGHHLPVQLSGGEQQRVALARAFAAEPALLFADEPTGNLDARTGASVLDLMRHLREDTGTTLVLVTHDETVASAADRVIRLEDGRVVADGTAEAAIGAK